MAQTRRRDRRRPRCHPAGAACSRSPRGDYSPPPVVVGPRVQRFRASRPWPSVPVMRHRVGVAALGVVLGSMMLGACGATTPAASSTSPLAAHWAPFRHVPGVVDLAGPRADGSFVVAAAGNLSVLAAGGTLGPFARGPNGYATARGPEPYIALGEDAAVAGTECSFSRDTLYALEPGKRPGVILVDAQGRARRVADLPAGLLPDGIAFDGVGRFGHRLLVTVLGSKATTVVALDCNGATRTVAARAPVAEGGVVVAPASFGRFGGDLIVPDEHTGRVIAIDPRGRAITVVRSSLPSGSDIGVESAGFVPPGFGRGGAAYLADRFSKGNPHPGTNSILRLAGPELARAGVRPGDLLVASEGGAKTIAVRCGQRCTVTHIANGPAVAHAEGHIVFALALR